MQSLVDRTGSEGEAASILRAMVRLGADTSIIRYEMSPQAARRTYVGAAPIVWNVRAIRR